MTDLHIAYGSSSGTAQDEACTLAALLSSNFNGLVCDAANNISFDDFFNPSRQSIYVFLVSTTGDGVAPSNMASFWKHLLRKTLPASALCHISFAVFGFGDSSYEKYNATARKLQVRLKQLGANELLPIGLGDDQSPYGYLSALDPWVSNLTALLLPESNNNLSPPPTAPIYTVHHVSPQPVVPIAPVFISLFDSNQNLPLFSTVFSNHRLTAPTSSQTVHHIILQLPHPIHYQAGDIAIIHPFNPPELCRRLATRLGVTSNLDDIYTIRAPTTNSYARHRLPSLTCSLSQLLSQYLDIAGRPKRSFFQTLSLLTITNNEEHQKLIELGSPKGYDLFNEYCVREHRSYVEVLEEFPSIHLSVEQLLGLIPPLYPRYFSITSTGVVNPNIVELCVGVVEYTTPYHRHRKGICSSYLASIVSNENCWVGIQRGSFRAPPVDKDLILIGPGTGVAPMRAMILERRQNSSQQTQTVLFYGCRYQAQDDLYDHEWTTLGAQTDTGDAFLDLLSPGISVVTAYSRDQPQKVYVTHHLLRYGKQIWTLLERGAYVYLSGSAKRMPQDVRAALQQIISKHGGASVEEAASYLHSLERKGRYVTEVW